MTSDKFLFPIMKTLHVTETSDSVEDISQNVSSARTEHKEADMQQAFWAKLARPKQTVHQTPHGREKLKDQTFASISYSSFINSFNVNKDGSSASQITKITR